MRNITVYRPRSLNLMGDFDRMVNSIFTDSIPRSGGSPAVDIKEEQDSYLLEAELPGLAEKEIDIQVKENLLTLSSKAEESEDEKKEYLLRERKPVQFKRSFILPKDVDQEKIEARYNNGVLALSLPKKPEAKPKTIDVQIRK